MPLSPPYSFIFNPAKPGSTVTILVPGTAPQEVIPAATTDKPARDTN